MSTSHKPSIRTRRSAPWRIVLWIAQIVLMIFYIVPGCTKAFMAPEELTSMGILWAADVPLWILRSIGLCEIAGAIGLILPVLTGIKPHLTLVAAKCFVALQVLAIGFHVVRGEVDSGLAINLVYLALAAFIVAMRTNGADRLSADG